MSVWITLTKSHKTKIKCPQILQLQVHAKPVRVPSRHQRLAEGAERGRERHHGQRHDDVVGVYAEQRRRLRDHEELWWWWRRRRRRRQQQSGKGEKGTNGRKDIFPLLVVYSRPRESVIFTIKLFIMINFTLKWGLVDNINMLVQPSMLKVDWNFGIDTSFYNTSSGKNKDIEKTPSNSYIFD